MKTITKSGVFRKSRYSNYTPGLNTSELFVNLPGSDDSEPLTNAPNGSASGWTNQDTVNTINTGVGALERILTSIFSPSYKYTSVANQQMLEEERRTNTILWVVIAVVLVLLVFLVVRKTK